VRGKYWIRVNLGSVNGVGFPANHQLVMDSLPQELIDKIIDDIPHPSLPSCSLVARRWRRGSQRRDFASVTFSSEHDLVLWCTSIPQDQGDIPSYVRTAEFKSIISWRKPALFGRVLKELTSLRALRISDTMVPRPDQLPSSATFGEFGKALKLLIVMEPRCTATTITSFVLSFPNLEDLFLVGEVSEGPVAVLPHTPQREPLVSLWLDDVENGAGISLAQCGLTSRQLSLTVYDAGLEALLTLSSEVIVELSLTGAWFLEIPRQERC